MTIQSIPSDWDITTMQLRTYTVCQNYMQIDIFVVTWVVFNKKHWSLVHYIIVSQHANFMHITDNIANMDKKMKTLHDYFRDI